MRDPKHIIVVGGGLMGTTLAERLSQDGYDVSMVESSQERLLELSEGLDVRLVRGNGATAPVLVEAGVERAGLVLAVTDSDEANLVVALLAARRFRVPRLVVRIRDAAHGEAFSLLQEAGDSAYAQVNPEAAAVDRIASLLQVPGALDVVSFMDGQLLVAGFRIGPQSEFAGLTVAHMKLFFAETPALVAAIQRGDRWIVPHGEEELHVGDLAYFAFAREELDGILALIGAPEEARRYVVIAGASRIGLALARRLETGEHRVLLIEADPARAQEAADLLQEAVVIRGTATDQTLLEEEEIERASTFVAASDDQEENLVTALLARRLGAARAFAVVDNPALVHLLGEISIDAIISPRQLAIGLALQYVRGSQVFQVAELLEDQIEIVEAEAPPGSRITRASLSELGLRGALVAAVRHDGTLRVPTGDDRVEAGDRVLLIAATEAASKIAEKLLGA